MSNFLIFLSFLGLVVCSPYLETTFDIGRDEQGQVLLWVEHKSSAFYDEEQAELRIPMQFDGHRLRVERITIIKYELQANTSGRFYYEISEGGPGAKTVRSNQGCNNCTHFSVTQRIFGINLLT